MRNDHISREALLSEWNAAPDSPLAKYAATWGESERLPRYLQALGALGAFMAMSMFLSFLGAVHIIDLREPLGMAIWGGIFTASALYFSSRSEERMETLGDTFVTQTTLMLLALGKVLLIWAVAGKGDFLFMRDSSWIWRVFGATAAITAVTYPFSRFYIDRYVSALATLGLLLLCILYERFKALSGFDMPFNIYYLLLLACAAWFFARPHYPVMLRPLRDAILSMLVGLTVLASLSPIFYKPAAFSLYPITLGLTIALLAITIWMAGGIAKVKASPNLLLACAGIIALGTLATPGILLAIGLMVLGYGNHERPLLINGALAFAGFIWLFYYNLDMTLLVKSTILAGSGALLLLARWQLHLTAKKEA
ncbi:MAG: DUF4401 domain-containing protein [Alphaproteobacteria bacterium]|nr:DUF4401 domain-containing protein [Alphaproteobacteria bacterium]